MTAILSDFLAIALELILVALGQWFEIAIVVLLALISRRLK